MINNVDSPTKLSGSVTTFTQKRRQINQQTENSNLLSPEIGGADDKKSKVSSLSESSEDVSDEENHMILVKNPIIRRDLMSRNNQLNFPKERLDRLLSVVSEEENAKFDDENSS